MYRALLCAAVLVGVPSLHAYSVLTHEAIIDSAWDANIRPLLLKRFPQSSPDDLLHAHAYAYGGCIIQDMGYYPFGSKFFSDLVHYVRSGDFVVNLVRDSQDLNEYAFALGALAHYAADNEGHPVAVNPSVAIQYPKLERKYGRDVTYEDNPADHLKVEFGFDVLQVARGHYAPQSYHDFIGFQVSKPVLERAFEDTYSLRLEDIFHDIDLALGTYRRTVSHIIPEMTKVAWNLKKDELKKADAGITRRRFVYYLSKASYRNEWDRKYEKPGVGARVLALFFRILPKVGFLRAADYKTPTPHTTALFETSFDKTMDSYRRHLAEITRGSLSLANRDFDTGNLTRPTEYRLADNTYSKLAITLADQTTAQVQPAVVRSILDFYRNLNLPYATKRHAKDWQKTLAAVDKLRSLPAMAQAGQ